MAAATGTGGKIPPVGQRVAHLEERLAKVSRWAETVNTRLKALEEAAHEGRALFVAHGGDEGAHKP